MLHIRLLNLELLKYGGYIMKELRPTENDNMKFVHRLAIVGCLEMVCQAIIEDETDELLRGWAEDMLTICEEQKQLYRSEHRIFTDPPEQLSDAPF